MKRMPRPASYLGRLSKESLREPWEFQTEGSNSGGALPLFWVSYERSRSGKCNIYRTPTSSTNSRSTLRVVGVSLFWAL